MKKITKILFPLVALLIVGFAFAACTSNKSTTNDSATVKTITTSDLKKNISNKDWVVVDTRSNDAFNGWILDGVKRGGHIKGATDFSANWLTVDDKDKDTKLKAALKTKGITADKSIVLYDANGKESQAVAEYLIKNGIKNIYKYDVKEWASDESLAMESYANYQMLVPASWVNDLASGKKPEGYTGTKYKIFEVAWGEESKDKDYLSGHIPGAVHINTDEIEEAPLWSIKSDSELSKFALNNGLTNDTTIVLYGTDPMASYRIAAIAKYIGVKDVRVLNGGFAAYKNAGYKLETTSNKKQPVTHFGTAIPANKNYIVGIDKAKAAIADKIGSVLVDIRSWDEYTGKITGYDDLKYKGRPAGSVYGHAGSDPNHLEDFRNIDNTMRNFNEVLAMWKENGITPDKNLVFMCGSGWRAAEVLIYSDTAGLKNIALYSNGWYEWSSNSSNPVLTGEPTK